MLSLVSSNYGISTSLAVSPFWEQISGGREGVWIARSAVNCTRGTAAVDYFGRDAFIKSHDEKFKKTVFLKNSKKSSTLFDDLCTID